MRKIVRFGWKWLVAALALALMAAPALADFDMGRSGTISVLIHTAEGVNVEHAHVELYRVGDPVIVNSNLTFVLSDDFAASGVSLADLSRSGLAAGLDAWLDGHPGIAPAAQADTGANGEAVFSDVPVGLYLAVQDGFSTSKKMYFSEIESFLVSMPMMDEGGADWTYSVSAKPKVNPLPTPKPTPVPTDPPADETLPQTGLLRWPIPVLGVGGLVLFSIGWALVFMKKSKAKKDA